MGLNSLRPQTFDCPSARDVDALRVQARLLRNAALTGSTQPLLHGKNLGLLCEATREASAELNTPLEIEHTARMLGRLYDALQCQGMAPPLVQQIRAHAGVPVYDGLAVLVSTVV